MIKEWYSSGLATLSYFQKSRKGLFSKTREESIDIDLIPKKGLDEGIIINNLYTSKDNKLTRTIFANSFLGAQLQSKGSRTDFEYMKELLQKEEKNQKKCIICESKGAGTITSFYFPFIITKQKFPNLYGGTSEFVACHKCKNILFAAYRNVCFITEKNLTSIIILYGNPKHVNHLMTHRMNMDASTNNYFKNVNITGSYYIYGAYYLLISFLDYITQLLNEQKELAKEDQLDVGALVLSADLSKSKKIYREFDNLNNLNLIITFLNKTNQSIKRNAKGTLIRPFSSFLNSLIVNPKDEAQLINRNALMLSLCRNNRLNWRILEEILFLKLDEYKKKSKAEQLKQVQLISFSRTVLKSYFEVFEMDKKELFNEVYKHAFSIGMQFKRNESRQNVIIKEIYDMRRARNQEEFMNLLNRLQLKIGTGIRGDIFIEHMDDFAQLKTFFLIGLTNAVFLKEKKESNNVEG
ncbi:hypothetical protein JXB41_04095 [Candidatus Woesearchaeota archaeon]|nr:hypothetical protein [Candidatus Woesearchaeota archaeon]